MLWWTQLHYLEPNPILYLGNKIKYSTSRLLFTKLNIPLKSTYHRYCGISLIWQYPQVLTLGLTDLFLGFSAHKAFHTISKLDEGGKDLLSNLFLKQGHPDGSPGSQRMDISQPLWTTYSSAGWPSEGKSVSCCEQTANASGAGQVSLPGTCGLSQKRPQDQFSKGIQPAGVSFVPKGLNELLRETRGNQKAFDQHQKVSSFHWLQWKVTKKAPDKLWQSLTSHTAHDVPHRTEINEILKFSPVLLFLST